MIKISGLMKKIKSSDEFKKSFFTNVRKSLLNSTTNMTRSARKDHEFNSKTGNAERSIGAVVDNKKIYFSFGIIKNFALTKWNGGVSYATFLHEGTGRGYRKSVAAKKYSPTKFKTGYGILADHFIVRAFDKYFTKLNDDLRSIFKSECERAL